jgi:hypothetical protein
MFELLCFVPIAVHLTLLADLAIDLGAPRPLRERAGLTSQNNRRSRTPSPALSDSSSMPGLPFG